MSKKLFDNGFRSHSRQEGAFSYCRGSWGSPDPLRFSDSGAYFTCLSAKVTDVVDTLNNFEQNPS